MARALHGRSILVRRSCCTERSLATLRAAVHHSVHFARPRWTRVKNVLNLQQAAPWWSRPEVRNTAQALQNCGRVLRPSSGWQVTMWNRSCSQVTTWWPSRRHLPALRLRHQADRGEEPGKRTNAAGAANVARRAVPHVRTGLGTRSQQPHRQPR